jgi:hypothetical protein
MLIGFDRRGAGIGSFICHQPDFRLADDDVGRVCGTNGAHTTSPFWRASILQGFVHGFLRGSVNAAMRDAESA